MAQIIKNLPVMKETWTQLPGQDNPREKGMANSYLENSTDTGAWWDSPWGHKELDTTEQLTHTDTHVHTHTQGCYIPKILI